MFNTQQLAYLRALASQSAGNAQVGFNRTRLLVRIGPTDDDWSASMLFIFLAGILLMFGLVVAYLGNLPGLAICVAIGLAGLYWAARRVLASRRKAQQKPPNFIFDSTERCFYVLIIDLKNSQAMHYERYPSHLLTASRVRILSSNAYFDDTVIECTFGAERWVKVLELNNSPLAYELERAIKYCQAFAQEH